jgi:hypothetical protein
MLQVRIEKDSKLLGKYTLSDEKTLIVGARSPDKRFRIPLGDEQLSELGLFRRDNGSWDILRGPKYAVFFSYCAPQNWLPVGINEEEWALLAAGTVGLVEFRFQVRSREIEEWSPCIVRIYFEVT